MPVEEQVVVIFAGTKGYLDSLPVEQVKPFEAALLDAFRTRHADLLGQIRDSGALPDEEKLAQAVSDVKAAFESRLEAAAPAGTAVTGADAPGEAESRETLETE
jgi:F-type H+-transporting ATPase subunit alpha